MRNLIGQFIAVPRAGRKMRRQQHPRLLNAMDDSRAEIALADKAFFDDLSGDL